MKSGWQQRSVFPRLGFSSRKEILSCDFARIGTKTKQASFPLLSLIALFMFLPLVLLLCGCASRYKEPPVVAARTAYLETFGAVRIVSIDGKEAPRLTVQEFQRFCVLPGEHVVRVRYLGDLETVGSKHSDEVLPLKFTALPAYTYCVSASTEGTSWKARIVRGSARAVE